MQKYPYHTPGHTQFTIRVDRYRTSSSHDFQNLSLCQRPAEDEYFVHDTIEVFITTREITAQNQRIRIGAKGKSLVYL